VGEHTEKERAKTLAPPYTLARTRTRTEYSEKYKYRLPRGELGGLESRLRPMLPCLKIDSGESVFWDVRSRIPPEGVALYKGVLRELGVEELCLFTSPVETRRSWWRSPSRT
jgi:hypothetical protein